MIVQDSNNVSSKYLYGCDENKIFKQNIMFFTQNELDNEE